MNYLPKRMEADPRRFPRYYLNRRGIMRRDGDEIEVWVVDISGMGARLAVDSMVLPRLAGPGWALDVPDLGRYPANREWSHGISMGVAFEMTEHDCQTLDRTLADRLSKLV